MKHFIKIFSLLLALTFLASCEDKEPPSAEPIAVERLEVVTVTPIEYDVDTTTTSGTADTTIVNLPNIRRPIKINLSVSLDSLSGAHNATHVLQVNSSFTDENTWRDLDTVTGNGVTVDDLLTGNVYYGRARVYSISNGTAQSFEKKIAGEYVPLTSIQ